MDSKNCKNLINMMDRAYKLLNHKSTIAVIHKWIGFGTQNIRLLNKILKLKKNASVGEKMKILTTIGILKVLNRRIRNLQKRRW